jgi:hypothetical protein
LDAYYSFVRRVIAAFGGAGLDYAFTGALAISFYGVPRTTSDVDVLVAVTSDSEAKTKLAGALCKGGLTVDEQKIDDAFTTGFRIASFKDKTSPFSASMLSYRMKN